MEWKCSARTMVGAESVQWRCPVAEPPEASLGELRTGGWNIFSRVKTPHRKHVQFVCS